MSDTAYKGYIEKKDKGSGEFQELYVQGIELLQKLSGATWTDYNAHDPGITIFENLAYALTDLSYKTSLPIKDILTESKGAQLKSGDNGFFIPSEILTTNPVIIDDLRKLLIDSIKNVKNVWIRVHDFLPENKKHFHPEKNIRGFYTIFIEPYEYFEIESKWEQEQERIKTEVTTIFHEHRNLCEDLYEVKIFEPLYLKLMLSVELDEQMKGEEVFAQIYYQVNDFLSHDIAFKSLQDLKEAKKNTNEIFEGPVLKNGFITDEELTQRKEGITISDITKIIANIPGVVNINSFDMSYELKGKSKSQFIKNTGEILPLQPHMVPRLLPPDENSGLSYTNTGIRMEPNIKETLKEMAYIEAVQYGNFKSVSRAVNVIDIPKGKTLDINEYFTIREQFPAIYGIGEESLGSQKTELRKAQVKQLKAYLLPYDQLMSNFLAQLTSIYSLYNCDHNELVSYFSNELQDTPQFMDLITTHQNVEKDSTVIVEEWQKSVSQLSKEGDTKALERLNEVADNLLARFSEKFPSNVLRKINATCYGKHFSAVRYEEDMLKLKRKLVHNYGQLSYNRAKSYNYTKLKASQDENNSLVFNKVTTAGIVEKISVMLGMPSPKRKEICSILKEKGLNQEEINPSKIRIHLSEKLLRYSIPGLKSRNISFTGNRKYLLKEVMKYGILDSSFEIVRDTRSSKYSYNVLFKSQADYYQRIFRTKTKKEAKEVVERCIHFLAHANKDSEGIHLVEHLLLLPDSTEAHFGFSFELDLYSERAVSFKQAKLLSNANRNKRLHSIHFRLSTPDKMKVVSERDPEGFRIKLLTSNNVLYAVSTTVFLKEYQVNLAIEQLCNRIKRKECVPQKIKYLAYYGDEAVDESFFSFQISLVLPSWPVRFQNSNFRTQLNNMAYEQAPAHIASESFWLDHEEMNTFEKTYFRWLELKANDSQNKEYIDTAFKLITQLKRLYKTAHP